MSSPLRLRSSFPSRLLAGLTLACVVFALAAWRQRRARGHSVPQSAAPMGGEPHLMLWAWEEPEDLRTLDPSRAGVAFLAREITLSGSTLQVRPRRQPLRVPDGIWLLAVVRLDVRSDTSPNVRPEVRPGPEPDVDKVVDAILPVMTLPNVRGLQLDFDATASQHAFYARLLRALRDRLPAGTPLSITALANWCGRGSWLHGASVEEAVPMLFRMGGPAATRATQPKSLDGLAEPLCASSAGVSTDERWPPLSPQLRVYVFKPSPWTHEDIARANDLGYEGLAPRALPAR